MEIVIDIEGDRPIFTQLMEQVKQAVLSGEVVPGEALPSIRQLANDLDINNKTVAKAYRLLERDSVIQSKGYRGTFVHPDAKDNCKVNLGTWVISKCHEMVDQLRSAGVTDSEIRIAFKQSMNRQSN